jgi:putative ABC transport system permease protein
MPTDIDFVKTMGLHIVSGNDFTRSDWMQMDTVRNSSGWHTSFLLNESAVRALGWGREEAIGRILYRNTQKGIVKGVVNDFHFASLHEPITPLVIFLDSQYVHIYQAFVKVRGKDIPSTLQAVAATWKIYVPHRPFQFHFLDENYDKLYHSEKQTAEIFSSFSTLAILLACLGLFALAAYTTVQRAREIGIRKVLGAGVLRIVMLLTGDFIRLVLLASLIAFPVAWLAMHSWLQNFAYRIDIGWWVFWGAGVSVAIIALATVSYQAARAAMTNPVKNLRTD